MKELFALPPKHESQMHYLLLSWRPDGLQLALATDINGKTKFSISLLTFLEYYRTDRMDSCRICNIRHATEIHIVDDHGKLVNKTVLPNNREVTALEWSQSGQALTILQVITTRKSK